MSVIIKKKEKQLAPIAMHLAHFVAVVDTGTHEGKFGKNRKVILSLELSECKAVFKEENGEEPFVLSNTYNKSLGKKSSLVRDLTPWIGSGFTKKADCDLGALVLGKACYANVIHETNDAGETYAKVIAFAPIPKGTAVPEQILPSLEYSVEDGFNDVFDQLPAWIQERIEASDEVAGVRPTVAEITERNVRQANANATSANDEADELVEVNTEAQLATASAGETEEIEIPY